MTTRAHDAAGRRTWLRVLLLVLPYAGLLWVPFYDRTEPALFGFPFFYWYQLAWVPVTSLVIWVAWRLGRTQGAGR